MPPIAQHIVIWTIIALAVAGVVWRPFQLPEAWWAVAGAALVAGLGLTPLADAALALKESIDVCLFLAGMMLLAAVARLEGVFDWIAAAAVNHARGSTSRLFLMVWLVGVAVTALLSNDATAVVLTPAVLAVARAARARPAPFLLACAFVANAASFVLPISNPANLVVFASHPPSLGPWLARLGLPAAVAIAGAFAALRWGQRRALSGRCAEHIVQPRLSPGGRWALAGVIVAGAVLVTVSALGGPIGAPTFLLGVTTAGAVLRHARQNVRSVVRGVSWSVLPLTAGLFVLVQALESTGLVATLAHLLAKVGGGGLLIAGAVAAAACNLSNNLPVGLLASHALARANGGPMLQDMALIGVDLGPNLTVHASLATILWLAAIRRERLQMSDRRFLAAGVLVAPASLIPALAVRLLIGG